MQSIPSGRAARAAAQATWGYAISEKLKACPFCQIRDAAVTNPEAPILPLHFWSAFVKCNVCEGRGSTGYSDKGGKAAQAAAIVAWNHSEPTLGRYCKRWRCLLSPDDPDHPNYVDIEAGARAHTISGG